MQSHTVYLFSQGGKKTGFGHISRLIPIYDEFVKNNIFVRFIISGDISVERILGKRNYNIISWRNLKFEKIRKNDVVIIDTINLPYDFIFKTNYFTKNIYFISDRFFKKKIKARAKVINWRVGSVSDKLMNEGLYGEKFVPLRNEIFKYRKEKFQYAIPKVVLSMGSGDILNLISHVLEIYKREYLKKFDLQVIMQSHHKNFDNILKQYGKDAKFLVDIQPSEIFEVISSSQFAIASGGHSIYEYSYIGTPVIHVLTAKNQHPATSWNDTGFTYPLGWYQKESFKIRLMKGIEYFLNLNNVIKSSRKGKRIIDGCGASRLVNTIIEECKIN